LDGRGTRASRQCSFKKRICSAKYTYVSQSPTNVSIMETFNPAKKEKEKKRSNKSSLISLQCFPSERQREVNYTAGGKNP
jgi:hypothetical protein